MSNQSNTVGQRLGFTRTLAGISGRRLAELAGVSTHYVTSLEAHERRDPRATLLKKVAEVLGAPVEWLALGAGEAPSEKTVRAAVEAAEAAALAEGRVRPLVRRRGRRVTCPSCGHAHEVAA